MALSPSLVTSSAGSGFGVQSYNTAVVTPVANRLYEVEVSISTFAAGPGAITLSGGGLSAWPEIDTQIFSGTTNRVSKFRGLSASPGAGAAIAISIGGSNNNSCQWSVHEWDGVDTSGTNGSGAIAQSAKNSTTGGAPNSLTVTLGSGITSGNAVSCSFAVASDSLQTPGSSYTEFSDNNSLTGSEANSLMSCYHLTGTTTPNASGQPDFADTAGIAAEVKAGASGVSGTMAAALAAITSAITGTTTVVGTMAASMVSHTSAITGTTTILGTMAASLANFTSSITATTTVVGTMAASLANFTSAITATTTVVGSMAASLANFTSSIIGDAGEAVVTVFNKIAGLLGFGGGRMGA